jgi:predicted ATPase with chaperone activity
VGLQGHLAGQLDRFKGMKIYCNAQMTNRHIKKFCQIDETSQKLLEMAIDKFGLSARVYTRILKVARTIADLEGQEDILPLTSPKRSSTGHWTGILLPKI